MGLRWEGVKLEWPFSTRYVNGLKKLELAGFGTVILYKIERFQESVEDGTKRQRRQRRGLTRGNAELNSGRLTQEALEQ